MSYYASMLDEYTYEVYEEEQGGTDFFERMLEEAAIYGILVDCPDTETEGDQLRFLIGLFNASGAVDEAHYWESNCVSVGLLDKPFLDRGV